MAAPVVTDRQRVSDHGDRKSEVVALPPVIDRPRNLTVEGAKAARTQIVTDGQQYALAIVPAEQVIDLAALATLMMTNALEITGPEFFREQFPETEPGGMPELGMDYGMPVYMDESLLSSAWIGFRPTPRAEVLKLDSGVFKRLVRPRLGSFTKKAPNR